MSENKKHKKVYPLMMRHMDLVWRRRFYGHFTAEGNIIRPYSDIEDLIFDQMIDLSDRYGYPGSAESAAQIRHYLERNPDKLKKVRKVVEEGTFALEGGGESLIDTNMVAGESIYRNLYYGLSYYRDEFGAAPKTAQCCDIFGLSAQLPQIFRQFGMTNINNYSRVFKNHKPFWKGLDSSLICIHRVEDTAEFCSVGHSAPPCSVCHGDGCEYCGFTGLDSSRFCKETNFPEQEKRLDEYFNRNKGADTLFMIENGEESLYPDDFPIIYEKMADKYGFEPVYASYDKYVSDIFPEDLRMLLEGNVPSDMIDERVEGNPVFCGCYTSRIKIKQYNRLIEDLLLSAETLSVKAFSKEDYPYLKLRDLWRDMALFQFHDCITGSHSDGAYEELRTLSRELTNGAGRLIREAVKALTSGNEGFTLFNLTDTDVEAYPLKAKITVQDDSDYAEIIDSNGNVLPVAEVKRIERARGALLDVTFTGSIKAYSSKHFTYRTFKKESDSSASDGFTSRIENEFYRVGREGIFDKALGKYITGAGLLMLTDEIGDPWAKFDPETAFISLTGSRTEALHSENMSQITYSGSYSNEKHGAKELEYSVTAKLYKGVKGVFYTASINWKGENCHIYADFPLRFNTEGKALYEIPFGTLERGPVDVQYDAMSIADSYPAIGFAACRNKKDNYTVALFNKGTPGYIVNNDGIRLSLLRSPTQDKHGGCWFDGARDEGHHEFSYMIASFPGTDDYSGDLVRKARLYNHLMPCASGSPVNGAESFAPAEAGVSDSVITSIRRTNEGRIQMRAYEPYGRNAVLSVNGAFTETDPLSEKPEEQCKAEQEFIFRPYEIKTITSIE